MVKMKVHRSFYLEKNKYEVLFVRFISLIGAKKAKKTRLDATDTQPKHQRFALEVAF